MLTVPAAVIMGSGDQPDIGSERGSGTLRNPEGLVVEKAEAGEDHDHAVLVRGADDALVAG